MTSSSEDEEAGGNPARSGVVVGEPSYLRQRTGNGVWPEHFVEDVVVRVAKNAARDDGRLAASRAVVVLFQVSSTWRRVSNSDLLWQTLTHEIWSVDDRQLDTWSEEYMHRHRTAHNFRIANFRDSPILVQFSPDNAMTCVRLALSEHHLGAGYVDGSVRLFDLPSTRHVATIGSHPNRDHLGPFSQSISGLVLDDCSSRLVFASQAGDIQVTSTAEPDLGSRLVRLGNLVEDGVLVDFTGCSNRWVGLFAGVPGRSLRVWDSESEEVLYVGSHITDPNAVAGWHMLTELTTLVGRVRIAGKNDAHAPLICCTTSRIQSINLGRDEVGAVLDEEEFSLPVAVESVAAWDEKVLVVDSRGLANVRRARTLEELARFSTGAGLSGHSGSGCLNWGYAAVCRGNRMKFWDIRTGEYLFPIRVRVRVGFEAGGEGEGSAMVVAMSDRYVAVWSVESGLHVWDFGAL